MILDDFITEKPGLNAGHYLTPFIMAGIVGLGLALYVGWFEFCGPNPSPHGIGVLFGLMALSFAFMAIGVDRWMIKRVEFLYLWIIESIALILLYLYMFG